MTIREIQKQLVDALHDSKLNIHMALHKDSVFIVVVDKYNMFKKDFTINTSMTDKTINETLQEIMDSIIDNEVIDEIDRRQESAVRRDIRATQEVF